MATISKTSPFSSGSPPAEKRESRFSSRPKLLPLCSGQGSRLGTEVMTFSWIDLWNVEARGTLQRSYYEKAVRLRADGLLVAKEGSASVLIYIQQGKAKWQQQGD